ncbi:phage tail protein [Aeromonas veronii]|uniref:phage tail protein n=1 Tax=Aeromonas veronii TaxID=654 RepID=UPI0031FD834E
MANYFALLTNQGAAKLANAASLGIPLKLTAMAVGDGNGQAVTPNPAATKLVNEKRRAPLNALFADPLNASQLVAEQIIPEAVGGWWIRELGLYDEAGTLIAVANCPETYKPLLSEGSGRTQVIRMVLIVSSTSDVELKIDPAVVLATRQYVDDVMKAHTESSDHPDASETAKGLSRRSTQAEVNASSNQDDTAYITPRKLWGWVKQASETVLGMMKVATPSQMNAGTADDVAVTPKKIRAGLSISLSDSGYIALPTWLGGLVFQWTLSQIINSGANGTVLLPFSNPGGTIAALTTHENGANDMPVGASYVGQIRSRAPGSVVVRNLGPQPAQFRIFTIGT